MMKAFCVFTGDSPEDNGCILVYAERAGQAKSLCLSGWPGNEYLGFLDMKARRKPNFDKYYQKDSGICVFDSNEMLPEPFFDDYIVE